MRNDIRMPDPLSNRDSRRRAHLGMTNALVRAIGQFGGMAALNKVLAEARAIQPQGDGSAADYEAQQERLRKAEAKRQRRRDRNKHSHGTV